MLRLKLQGKIPFLIHQEKNKDNWHYRIHTETKAEMGHSKNEGQYLDQTLHRVAAKERQEIKRTTKQKMSRRRNKEGGNYLEQESRRKTKEDIGELHFAVDGQSLGGR